MSRINPVARHAAPQVRKIRSDPRPAEPRKKDRKKRTGQKHIAWPEETKCVFGPCDTKQMRVRGDETGDPSDSDDMTADRA